MIRNAFYYKHEYLVNNIQLAINNTKVDKRSKYSWINYAFEQSLDFEQGINASVKLEKFCDQRFLREKLSKYPHRVNMVNIETIIRYPKLKTVLFEDVIDFIKCLARNASFEDNNRCIFNNLVLENPDLITP